MRAGIRAKASGRHQRDKGAARDDGPAAGRIGGVRAETTVRGFDDMAWSGRAGIPLMPRAFDPAWDSKGPHR